jgi:hypothetical protein
VSTNLQQGWFTVDTLTTSNGFVRLVAPNGQATATGQILTLLAVATITSNLVSAVVHLGTNIWTSCPTNRTYQYSIAFEP